MNLSPIKQTNLYGLSNSFTNFVELYKKNKLPNKILLSGQKGIGKSTLVYHLINFVLSSDEELKYDLKNFSINKNNKSFKLVLNKSNPNFKLIDITSEKKVIDISQIRNLINDLNKSSLNNKPRFVLIDNIEYLNTNSVNALLKIIEEPTQNTYFFLINNNKKILKTLLSRCLNFKINLTNKQFLEISENLLGENIHEIINDDLYGYYSTPGKIYSLSKYAFDNDINLKNINLKNLLSLSVDNLYYKKDENFKNIVFELVEFFIFKKLSLSHQDLCSYFIKRINDIKKYNLDEESFFIEFKSKFLNA
jgi:DNA polymerase-3 subunit delta'